MLLQFSLENYRVFKYKARLNLQAQKACKEHNSTLYTPDNFSQVNIQPFAVLYGDNGAGKSIFFEALGTLIELIKLGIVQSSDSPVLEPFLLDQAKKNQPSHFELTFIGHDGFKYHYLLTADNQRVHFESLHSVSKKGARAKLLFERQYRSETNDCDYQFGTFSESSKRLETIEQDLREYPRSTLLGLLALGENRQISELVGSVVTSVIAVTGEKVDTFLGQQRAKMFSLLAANGDKPLKQQFIDLLNQFDLNIADIEVAKHDLPPQAFNRHQFLLQELDMEYDIQVYHNTPWGISESMPFHHFSCGNRRVIGLLCFYLLSMRNKRFFTLALDEIDTSIHPNNLIKLKALFTSSQQSQLLITSNNPHLLTIDHLRRDQVWFIEKSTDLASDLYPLWDFAPKIKENLAQQWLDGCYSNR